MGEPRRDDLTGRATRHSGGESVGGEPRLWFGGQALGTAAYAQRVMRRVRARHGEVPAITGVAADLGALARAVAHDAGVTVAALHGPRRSRGFRGRSEQLEPFPPSIVLIVRYGPPDPDWLLPERVCRQLTLDLSVSGQLSSVIT